MSIKATDWEETTSLTQSTSMKIALSLLVVVLILQPAVAYKSLSETLSGFMCQLFLGDIPRCPATSCKEIADTKLAQSRSGQHWLTDGSTSFQAYCGYSISPSLSRGWMRVGYVSSSQGCPTGLGHVTAGGKKLCAKTVNIGCSSVIFSTHGLNYTKVCGRVYGYQKQTTDGFQRFTYCPGCTIEKQYVDGVSITHGSPGSRQHIWTLATSHHETLCACSNNPTNPGPVPGFVGQDYFCDVEGHSTYTYSDRLWDGHSCLSTAPRCCHKGNWFCKDLPQATSDDIEFRLCTDEGRDNEDVYIEHVELYIQ